MFILHMIVFPKTIFTQAATEVIKLGFGREIRKSTLILTCLKILFHHIPRELGSLFTWCPI